jgi:hypothetical protein
MIRRATLALAMLLTAGTRAHQPTRATDAEVTLAIFSGRVDPAWVLKPAEAAELRTRLMLLPRTYSTSTYPANLGYLRVLLPAPGHSRRDVITFDHGLVLWQSRKVILAFADPDRKLEAWLLATGRGRTSEDKNWFEIKDMDRHP